MTTSTAGNVAGQADKDKDKEKMEKRRALGRGLASLLPGPRVVPAAPTQVEQASPSTLRPNAGLNAPDAAGTRAGVPGPHVPASGDEQQVPHRGFAPVRNDNAGGAALGEGAEQGIEIVAAAESRMPGNLVVNLALEQIDKNPFQTRYVQDNDNLEELAESIKASGVVQPIVVRPAEEAGRYILILGERRLHASKKAGKDTIPALIRRVSDQQAAEMTIIENLQREDLSPLEQAQAFKVLSQEFQ